MKKYFLIGGIILFIVIAVYFLNLSRQVLKIKLGSGIFYLKKASTLAEQEKGLMFVKKMNENQGMIFIFPTSTPQTFWNQNTLIPLDVLWIQGNIITGINYLPDISKGLTLLVSRGLVDKVIELNASSSQKFDIKQGDIIQSFK